ncbi:uncharacterized protein LOC112450964 isoform X1 [Kryptolebias marmoratus]|uniref:uncharacterized protein LOC112450964 isoform X1 n=1 Tax=Kryptolebias marmoratus TaxID=37003 RepID=UPI000D53022F|nr:uncharacterized protein LOC112450964 isoform X1 [Kryptolebias marmoratus]
MPEAELNLTPTHPPPEQPIGSPEPPGSGVLVEPRDPPDLGEEEEEARRRSVRRTRSMMSDQEAQDRDRDRDHAQVQIYAPPPPLLREEDECDPKRQKHLLMASSSLTPASVR